MIYQIYFLVFVITLLVTYEIFVLFKKGYRIKFEDKHFRIENIQKGVRFVRQKIIGSGINAPTFITNSNKATYMSLKRDFPNFDIDALKEQIKKFLIDYLKENKNSNIRKTNNFINDVETLSNNEEIEKESMIILRTIMNKYGKDNGLAKIEFDTTLEYNRNYENGVPRKIQENYITEFINAYTDLKKTRKIPCPNCGKEFLIVNKNMKCPHCNKTISDDIWYLNKIRKI